MSDIQYGAGLTLEARLARLEQRCAGATRRKRWSLGVAPMPNGAGDYVQAYSNTGVTTSPYFALLSSSYPATGMLTIAALDLLAGSQNWRVRTFYNWLAGDTRLFYSTIIAANVTGTYGITSNVNVGAVGVYAEGTESGALNNPITVGGSGHRMYSYVGAWSDRSALVASGRQLFGAQCSFSASLVAVGWFGETGLEVETL